MKRTTYLIAVVLAVIFAAIALAGCATTTAVSEEEEETISGTGTTRLINMEGGFYGILGNDNKNYDPTNLNPEFQKDGLNVKFQAKTGKNIASIHMWGTPVELISIERLDTGG